jgi:hypothetical protein
MAKMKRKVALIEVWESKALETLVKETAHYLRESFTTLYDILVESETISKHGCIELTQEVLSTILQDSMAESRNKLHPTLLEVVSKEIRECSEEDENDDHDSEEFEPDSKRRKPDKKPSKKKVKAFEKAFMNFMEEVDDDNSLECATSEMITMYEDMVDRLDY